MKTSIISWLFCHVKDSKYVSDCITFGSFLVPGNKYLDVDIIIILKERNVRILIARIKKEFEIAFHKRLDVTLFHCTQKLNCRRFMKGAGSALEL